MPKRRERVAPPPATGGWDLRYATSDAVGGWEELCRLAPTSARSAWERLSADPGVRSARQHPLKGNLSSRTVNGKEMEQWQYEVTGAGRIWYCIDDSKRTVWLTDASPGHPAATD